MTATQTTEARYSVFKLDRFYRVWDARENTFVRNPMFEFPTTDFDFRSDAARVCDELNATDTATQPEPMAETPAESDDDSDDDQPTRPAARKPMDHLPKQPRRRTGKPGRFNTPARRAYTLTRLVQHVNTGLVTVADYLASIGADSDTVRRYSSQVGKRAKALYAAKFGTEPARRGLAVVGRHLARCFAYDRADAEILREAVASYPKTSHLLTIGA